MPTLTLTDLRPRLLPTITAAGAEWVLPRDADVPAM
jgi:hypothetical protein